MESERKQRRVNETAVKRVKRDRSGWYKREKRATRKDRTMGGLRERVKRERENEY
jgi:hypothetical protein